MRRYGIPARRHPDGVSAPTCSGGHVAGSLTWHTRLSQRSGKPGPDRFAGGRVARPVNRWPPFGAWNGSWNGSPRNSSAISASGAVRRAAYAGSGAVAYSRASRNAQVIGSIPIGGQFSSSVCCSGRIRCPRWPALPPKGWRRPSSHSGHCHRCRSEPSIPASSWISTGTGPDTKLTTIWCLR
jgi:hypothetical protein